MSGDRSIVLARKPLRNIGLMHCVDGVWRRHTRSKTKGFRRIEVYLDGEMVSGPRSADGNMPRRYPYTLTISLYRFLPTMFVSKSFKFTQYHVTALMAPQLKICRYQYVRSIVLQPPVTERPSPPFERDTKTNVARSTLPGSTACLKSLAAFGLALKGKACEFLLSRSQFNVCSTSYSILYHDELQLHWGLKDEPDRYQISFPVLSMSTCIFRHFSKRTCELFIFTP